MPPLGPLRFRALLKRAIWGGRRLETLLGKSLGPGADFAESWELVDHGGEQSVVVGGPHAGQTLADLLRNHAAQLLGPHAPRAISGQDTPSIGGRPTFPLLVKFLDAHQPLSVQVHPDDAFGARLQPPDLDKTEAWVVVHAEPGSVIYAGLKHGYDRHAFEREVARGTTELCLHRLEPRVGDWNAV